MLLKLPFAADNVVDAPAHIVTIPEDGIFGADLTTTEAEADDLDPLRCVTVTVYVVLIGGAMVIELVVALFDQR